MPIVITQDILAATLQPEAGWCLLQLTGYKEKENKDRTGMDMLFAFECVSGPGNSNVNKGRRVYHTVYANAIAAMVPEECRKYIELISALSGLSKEQLAGESFDPSDFVGRTVWGEIKDEPYEGRIMKRINSFAPDDVVPF
jgi:hypothetical protein